MTTNSNKTRVYEYLLTNLCEDIHKNPVVNLFGKLRAFILSEENRSSIITNTALAMNFIPLDEITEENADKLYDRFVTLSEFVKENNLRFPLEEVMIEELVLQEDDGAGVGSNGPGSITAPASPIATNNTSGVAKLDYPIGKAPKRKKEDAIDSPTS